MQLPLTLLLRPSPSLVGAVCLAHLVVTIGFLASHPAPAWYGVFGLAMALSLALFAWRQVIRPPLRALTLKADGRLQAELGDGCGAEGTIHPGSTVFPWLIVLRLRLGQRPVVLILPPDALPSPDGHRVLRTWLRWRAETG